MTGAWQARCCGEDIAVPSTSFVYKLCAAEAMAREDRHEHGGQGRTRRRAHPRAAGRQGDGDARQLAVWDRIAQSRGRVAGPFAALLHSPELARRIAETGHYVRFEGPLTRAERGHAISPVR